MDKKSIGRVAVLLLLGLIAAGCDGGSDSTAIVDPPAITGRAILFENANLITMTDTVTVRDARVLIRDGRIAEINGPARRDDDIAVIDAHGRYLMPGLIDMHVHVRRADLPEYARAGITTVRNMWGYAALPPIVSDAETARIISPIIISASPGIDGPPPRWPETILLTDPALAASVVAQQSRYAFVKVYTDLSVAVYDSILAAARRNGQRVVGHVPRAVPIETALQSGQESIEHLTGYDRAVSRSGRSGANGWVDADTALFAHYAQLTAQRGVWNCPTLAIYEVLTQQNGSPDAVARNRQLFVRALSRAGARILAGTDSGIDVVQPGTSMHDELAQLVASGLTPFQALRAATTDAAAFLERSDLGRIAVGARADLVLLSANPLADIRNLRSVDGVVLGGRWQPY